MIVKDAGPGKTVVIQETPEELAAYAAEYYLECASSGIRERGRFSAAFSGGKTPVGFFNALAQNDNKTWLAKSRLFQVDERMVSADCADSNQRLIMESLVQPAGFPQNRFYPVPVHLEDAAKAAKAYQTRLHDVLCPAPPKANNLDFVLLGVGSDGHTASLFPEEVDDYPKDAWVHAARSDRHPHDRITLAMPFILAAEKILFLISGASKAEIVRNILCDQAPEAPASMVWKKARRAVMALDQSASGAYLDSIA
ncbi:6-phosphogluconolactonase [Desulfatibacillum alkenivorans DSM 16219]|jgi:6-phosphogluconolactonase|uniref:6-phosphogluconolactonase n=1 Tax=Desulfatibacillum alkenivorans DSM 16219 TaxID=1121393 RepID=A0A1M6RAI1_9BACT|nr:6-phosphogluconolactonase [Desulfatibacillum alkenivorans]SHK29436.1 6-phosphogluconolactonase [Desulfatibacillum alkenivorans DSM 16219]